MYSLTSKHRTYLIIGAAIVIAVAGVSFSLWKVRTRAPTAAVTLPPLAASTQSPITGLTPPAGEPDVASTPYRGEPVTVLDADPQFLKQVPLEAYQKSIRDLALLAERLEKNPTDTPAWMQVAYIKHFYNDDIGSRDVYEHLNLITNQYALPFYNLALIYGYNLKEPQKAVSKFEAAIARDPLNASYYIGFSDFYREVMRDFASAERVLLRGLAKLSGEANLASTLGAVYQEKGNVANAIVYYEKALASPLLGPGERAAISAEVEKLKALQQ